MYQYRPMSCRTFGLPVRFGGEALPPCALCFNTASPEEIEHCRVEPDPNGLENRILDTLPGGGHGETLVAFVLSRLRRS
jgi:Fe-S-cluster containining protein